MLLLFVASLAGTALAESPDVLGTGAQVVYAGVGASTFASIRYDGDSVGTSGVRDRPVLGRVDLFASRGLLDRLQVSAHLPLVASVIIDNPNAIPCPRSSAYCDAILAPGALWVDARTPLLRGDLRLTAGLGFALDPWNAQTRGQFNAVGPGAYVLAPEVLAGRRIGQSVDLNGWLRYGWGFGVPVDHGPDAPIMGPVDALSGGIAGKWSRAGWSVELGASGAAATEGTGWDADFQSDYWPTDDRWMVLRYGYLQADGKISFSLGESGGLHIGASRSVLASNTPYDSLDLSVGVHRYWGGKRSD